MANILVSVSSYIWLHKALDIQQTCILNVCTRIGDVWTCILCVSTCFCCVSGLVWMSGLVLCLDLCWGVWPRTCLGWSVNLRDVTITCALLINKEAPSSATRRFLMDNKCITIPPGVSQLIRNASVVVPLGVF